MKEGPVPFFARFLEGQEYPEVQSDVTAGPGNGTTPHADQLHTLKYPSDNDEGGPVI